MNILYIHSSPVYGGSSKSISEIVSALNGEISRKVVVCPAGPVVSQFEKYRLKVDIVRHVSQFDNTLFGGYKRFRWLVLLREIFFFPSVYFKMKRLVMSSDFDLIHLNEITLMPWAWFLKKWSGRPVVVHVRSLQRQFPCDRRTRWFHRMLKNDVDKVIAIDETVRRTLPNDLPVTVIHNSMKVNAENYQGLGSRTRFRVAIIGVLLKLKGIYEFLEAARILVRERGYDIEFYIVGENSRELSGLKAAILKRLDLAHDVRGDIEAFVETHSLEEHIVLTGFVEDVQRIYADLDVLCFPSHLNAAGRPVFEAAFYGVPSIVAVKDPPADTIVDGETGVCIDKPDGILLADAIERLFRNREELEFLGRNAKQLAQLNFDIKENAEALLQVYKDAIAQK